MKKPLLPLLLALVCLPWLSACGKQESASVETGVFAEVSTELRQEMRQASEKVHEELATENMEISEDSDSSHAEITPQGDLLIDGQPVAITADQRQLLLEYRAHIANIAAAGARIGMQGASLAISAMDKAFAGVLNGNTDQIEREIEAEAKKIAERAQDLCQLMPAMLDTEQQLAAALPEFRPYADMTQADIDDCRQGELDIP